MADLSLIAGDAAVAGTVTVDGDSRPTSAVVVLVDDDGIPVAETVAASDGSFALSPVPAGDYGVVVIAPGFTFAAADVTAVSGATAGVGPAGTHHALTDTLAPITDLPDNGDGGGEGEFTGGGSILSTIRGAIDGLKESLEDALKVPREVPEYRGDRRVFDACGPHAARAREAIRRALLFQRLANNAFQSWTQQYFQTLDLIAADVGIFGVRLLQFGIDLTAAQAVAAVRGPAEDALGFARRKLSRQGDRLLQTGAASTFEEAVDASAQYGRAKEIFDRLWREVDEARELVGLAGEQIDRFEEVTGAISAGSTIAGKLPDAGPEPETADAFAVFQSIQRLGLDPTLANATVLVRDVAEFSGDVLDKVSTIGALADALAGIGNRAPAVKRYLDRLGPIVSGLTTLGSAGRALTGALGAYDRLSSVEYTYRQAIARRDRAIAEAETYLNLARASHRGESPDSCPPEDPESDDRPDGAAGGAASTRGIGSFDPNDIAGPVGPTDQNYVRSTTTFGYRIRFENIDTADAPAQEVFVTHPISGAMDRSTFRVGSFGFGGRTFDVPAGLSRYETRLDLTDTLGFYVDVTAGIDPTDGVATWTFRSIDPATGDLITDVSGGFLPPNVASPEGEGFVRYTIEPASDIDDDTVIDAQAEIVFDVNEPIDTPVYRNRIDESSPTSSVDGLPADNRGTPIAVSWGGDDGDGSGVAIWDVLVSVDGGSFTPWLRRTSRTSATYAGAIGRTYAFHSVATDGVGLREAAKSSAEATTRVVLPAWTNPRVRFDTNDIDGVTVIDALSILNELRTRRFSDATTGALPADPPNVNAVLFYDINADTRVTPIDALLILNELRRRAVSGGGEAIDPANAVPMPTPADEPPDRTPRTPPPTAADPPATIRHDAALMRWTPADIRPAGGEATPDDGGTLEDDFDGLFDPIASVAGSLGSEI